MKRFVYNQKYAKLLVSMAGRTSQIDELAREIDAHSGHLRIVLEQWHKEEIISKDKPGRDYQIKLTDKGETIATKLAELMQLVDENKEKKAEKPKNIEPATEEDEKFIEEETKKQGGKNNGPRNAGTGSTTSIQN